MEIRWGEVAGALVTFLVLVALPLGAIQYIPSETMQQLEATGLNIQSLATQTAVLGLVVSALALVKAVVAKASIVYLLVDVSTNIFSLAFALLVVGVGNIGNLGYSSFSLKQAKLTTEILLDLRVFIWLTVAVVGLSVLQSIARYREAKKEEALKQVKTGETAPVTDTSPPPPPAG
jgi:hypothetical protein